MRYLVRKECLANVWQKEYIRDVRGKEREKTGTGKKLERTRFFPFPFLQILTSAHLYCQLCAPISLSSDTYFLFCFLLWIALFFAHLYYFEVFESNKYWASYDGLKLAVEMCAEMSGKKKERERNWKERVSFLSRSYKFWPAHISRVHEHFYLWNYLRLSCAMNSRLWGRDRIYAVCIDSMPFHDGPTTMSTIMDIRDATTVSIKPSWQGNQQHAHDGATTPFAMHPWPYRATTLQRRFPRNRRGKATSNTPTTVPRHHSRCIHDTSTPR